MCPDLKQVTIDVRDREALNLPKIQEDPELVAKLAIPDADSMNLNAPICMPIAQHAALSPVKSAKASSASQTEAVGWPS